jgi:Ser/Thr protein kinase RdoA (MazF antagonist)
MAIPFDAETLDGWGVVELSHPAGGGARNDVWIGNVNGERCVVRRTRRRRPAVDWELDVSEAVARAGVLVPSIVRTRDGARRRGDIVIFTYVDGRPPDGHDDWLAVATYLEAVHASLLVVPQRPGFRSARDLLLHDVGGDADLAVMPPEVVQLCRRAWSRLPDQPAVVVHGDPGASNVLITNAGVLLIDWDECRVDSPLFDLAALPRDVAPLDDETWWIASQAASAWEVAVSWVLEPDYARRRLAELEDEPAGRRGAPSGRLDAPWRRPDRSV